MTTSQDEDARNVLLDELKSSVEEWADRRIQEIDDEETFLKSVLRGRTGSERLRAATSTTAQLLTINSITSLLTGGS